MNDLIESLFTTSEQTVIPEHAEEYTKVTGDSDTPKNYDEI